jgi:hypothetical protein
MVLDVDGLVAPFDDLAVTSDDIIQLDLIAQLCNLSINGHPAVPNDPIGLAPRTNALLGKKLIDAHGRS